GLEIQDPQIVDVATQQLERLRGKSKLRPERTSMRSTATFTEEEYSQVIRRIDKMVPTDLVSASSVAILIERGPQLGILGSGTLFRIGEESFVITAAHVMT